MTNWWQQKAKQRYRLVRPNPKYIENLLKIYDLVGRKPKQVPEHASLGAVDTSEELDEEGQKLFRRGLGICVYLCQDRLDIQFCVKTLAGKTKAPTKQAETGLKQLIQHVAGTQYMSFWLQYTKVGTRLASALNGHTEQEGQSLDCVGVFCDLDWAGNSDRRSTSCVIILLNALVVLSYSRTQAETLPMSSGASESLLLKSVWEFMMRRTSNLELRSDSSSGRQWAQRAGVGRLKRISERVCWIQRAVKGGWLDIIPIGTHVNVADINTKRLSAKRQIFQTLWTLLVGLLNAWLEHCLSNLAIGCEKAETISRDKRWDWTWWRGRRRRRDQ